MLATLEFLFIVCKSINKNHHTIMQTIHIRLRIPIIIGLVLVIIGSDISARDLINHDIYPIQLVTKIGIMALVVVFAFIVLITIVFLFRRSCAESGEQRPIKVIAASLPSLVARLLYVILT